MFNNAGIAVGGDVRDIDIDAWRKVLDVNLNGVVHGVASAYPIMVKQGFGHIINTASIEGPVAFPGTASYVASKHAVVGLSNSLRLEGEDLGVKVSVVCPGHIKTAIFNDSEMVNIDRKKVLEYVAKIPGITPAQCANVILKGPETFFQFPETIPAYEKISERAYADGKSQLFQFQSDYDPRNPHVREPYLAHSNKYLQ